MSMPEARNSVAIARAPADVFAFLADGTTNLQWRDGVTDIRLKSGTGIGAIYEQGVNGPFGRRVPADYEITGYEPNRPIAFRAIAGPVRPEGAYELEPAAGGTRLTFRLNCSPSGWSKIMAPLVAKTMRSEVAQLDRLRAILEM
jgi:hypothetical protein